jgi:hypothetical protein
MRVALIACACTLVLAAPASAGELPTVPAEWQGIWEVTTTVRIPCEIGAPMQSMSTDTLCAGDVIDPTDPDGPVAECSGTATATTYALTCTATDTIDGCEVTIVTDFQGIRDGDTYSQSGTVITTASDPKLCGFTEFCTEYQSMGTRIAADPDCEATPTESRSWGEIKAEYR